MEDAPPPYANDLRAKVFRDREFPEDWRVEKMDEDGGCEVAVFSGGVRELGPSGTPIASIACSTRSSWCLIPALLGPRAAGIEGADEIPARPSGYARQRGGGPGPADRCVAIASIRSSRAEIAAILAPVLDCRGRADAF